jgi:hypothetical protein
MLTAAPPPDLANLKRWASMVNGKSDSYRCRRSFVPVRRVNRSMADPLTTGDQWHVCGPQWTRPGCLAVSIGIGGEWSFEDGLVDAGCTVHGFDPTRRLRQRHKEHASDPANQGRLRFEYMGLGVAGTAKTWPSYGGIAHETTVPLDELLRRVSHLGTVACCCARTSPALPSGPMWTGYGRTQDAYNRRTQD